MILFGWDKVWKSIVQFHHELTFTAEYFRFFSDRACRSTFLCWSFRNSRLGYQRTPIHCLHKNTNIPVTIRHSKVDNTRGFNSANSAICHSLIFSVILPYSIKVLRISLKMGMALDISLYSWSANLGSLLSYPNIYLIYYLFIWWRLFRINL